jgi:hypothetical protein
LHEIEEIFNVIHSTWKYIFHSPEREISKKVPLISNFVLMLAIYIKLPFLGSNNFSLIFHLLSLNIIFSTHCVCAVMIMLWNAFLILIEIIKSFSCFYCLIFYLMPSFVTTTISSTLLQIFRIFAIFFILTITTTSANIYICIVDNVYH